MKTKSSIAKGRSSLAAIGLAMAAIFGSLQQASCAVGYVNISLRSGLTLIANPLVYPTNDANSLMPSAPEGTSLYRFDPVSQTYKDAATFFTGFGWCPVSGNKTDPALILDPGEGFWVESPQDWTNTFIGSVLQGSLTNPIPANYSLKASMVPQGGRLQTDLIFPPRPSDVVWKWLGLAGFDAYNVDATPSWFPAGHEPSLGVSEAFVVRRDPNEAIQANWWIRNFSLMFAQAASETASSNSTDPQILAISVRSGDLTLEVRNTSGGFYNVQFSGDGLSWTTVARKVKGESWKTRYPGGTRGFYQLSNP